MPWVGVSAVYHPQIYRCVASMFEILSIQMCFTIMYTLVTAITFCIQFVASFSTVEPMFRYWVPNEYSHHVYFSVNQPYL